MAPSPYRFDAPVDPQDAAEVAAAVLRNVWIRDTIREARDALYVVPVDPVKIADTIGVQVYGAGLPEGVFGKVVRRRSAPAPHPSSGAADDPPAIYLNLELPDETKRFTCAHEIGHIFDPAATAYELIDHVGTLTAKATDPRERWANQFAAALLMPESNVRRMHQRGMSALEIARECGVAGEAAYLRLRELELVP